MKIFGISLIMLVTMTTNCLAQESNEVTNTASPDDRVAAVSTEAELLELVAIFNDAIDAPTEYNAYVKAYLNFEGFPIKGDASKTEYDKMLVNWINANSETIKQFYIDRQKAHDELYGPRK